MKIVIPQNRKNQSKPVYYIFLFILFFHLFYFAYQIIHQHDYLSDSYEYLAEADNIRNHQTFYCGSLDRQPLNPDLFTKRTPVYPLFIAAIYSIYHSDDAILFIQMLLSLFNLLLVIKIWKLLNIPRGTASFLVYGGILLFYPAQFIYANMIMAEILFQTCLLVSLYFFVRFVNTSQIKYVLLYNAAIIFAMITKPVFYLFIFVNPVILLFYAVRNRKMIYLATALLPIFFVLLYCSWNASRTGYFHYSSIQNINLLHYNAYHLLLNVKDEKDAESTVDRIAYHAEQMQNYSKQQKYIQKSSLQLIDKYKWEYLKFHLRGTINFFIDPGRFDIYHFFDITSNRERGLLYFFSKEGYRGIISYLSEQSIWIILFLLGIAAVNVLKTLALVVFAFAHSIKLEIRAAVLLIVGYVAIATGPLGAARFVVPIFPLIMITVPPFIETIKRWYRRLHETRSEQFNPNYK